MNKQIYIGVDNGLAGALVALHDNDIDTQVMPVFQSTKSKREYDIHAIIEFFKKYPTATVILEKAHAMPKLGTVQAFNFGKGFGIMIGIVSALQMKYHIVHAKTWQKEMFRDLNYEDTKQASAIVAQRLFPDTNFKATERSKKIHDGITDAALLAEYGKRCL